MAEAWRPWRRHSGHRWARLTAGMETGRCPLRPRGHGQPGKAPGVPRRRDLPPSISCTCTGIPASPSSSALPRRTSTVSTASGPLPHPPVALWAAFERHPLAIIDTWRRGHRFPLRSALHRRIQFRQIKLAPSRSPLKPVFSTCLPASTAHALQHGARTSARQPHPAPRSQPLHEHHRWPAAVSLVVLPSAMEELEMGLPCSAPAHTHAQHPV